MWLVVGLGNPEPEHLLNRHNIGFMAIDAMIASDRVPRWRSEMSALTLKASFDGKEILFVKPQTYMNLSGRAVRSLLDYYKIELNNLLVVHDDIDQKFGSMRVQRDRGAGGHNGIKSITEQLGTQDYIRLKLGVGRPSDPRFDVAAYVLQNFSSEEMRQMSSFLDQGADAIECVVREGWEKAANTFNRNTEKDLS